MLKPLRKVLLTTLGLLPMLMPVDDVRAADMSSSESNDYLTSSASELPWRKARLSLEAQTGSRNIGTLDVMLPFLGNDDFIVYADLMAKGTTDKSFEGNLGLGFRRVNDAETGIFGMYAFYDVLKSENQNQFTQVTVGAEHLGLVWDFRANAYLPVGKTKYVHNLYSGGRADIVNNNIVQYFKTSEEESTYGGDAEVGRMIGTPKLRGYIAAYTFGQDLTGPRARLEYQMNSHVTLNTAVQHDKARGTQYFVGARFTVGGAKTTNSDSIYARLTDPVVRDIDIVTKSKVSDATRTAIDKFWMVDQTKTQSGGKGTLDNPYATIEDAIKNAPEGAIIYVKGVDGKIYNAGNGTKLKTGQVIIGGDQDVYFDFERNIAHFSANSDSLFLMGGNGIRPTISGTLVANSSVGFYNLNLMANELAHGDVGISVFDAKDVVINNVSVSGFNAEDGHGILVSGDSQVTLNNFSANNNFIGVDVLGGQVNVTDTLKIDQSQAIGLRVSNGQLSANAISIGNSAQHGIFASGGSITVAGDLAVNGGASGVVAQLGANIKANSAHFNNTDLAVDASHIEIIHDLNISSNHIVVSHGGSVLSDIANISAHSINFNQGMWNSKQGAVTINGTSDFGLWLQNASQVQLGATTISNAATSLQVDSGSTLTLTDNLTTDNTVVLSDAILNLSNASFGKDLTIIGANSQLNSSGRLRVTNDVTINQGALIAKDLTLNGDVTITAHGQANASNALTIDAADKKISLTDGGNLKAQIASVTTGTILIDNAVWNLTSSAAAVTATKNIVLQNSGVADFGAASVTAQGGLSINGANSQLISNGSVTVEQDVVIDQGGHLNGKTMEFKGNVDILDGNLSASDHLIVAANKTHHFTVAPQGKVIDVDKATISTGSMEIGGEFVVYKNLDILDTDHISLTENARMAADVANITTAGLQVDGGQLISKNKVDGQLTVNGAIQDSFSLKNDAYVSIAKATITDSNITVNKSILETEVLTVSQKPVEEGSTKVAPFYVLDISNDGTVSVKGEASIVLNKVMLANSTLDMKKGVLAVKGSDADGVLLNDDSELQVKTLTVEHSALNGVVINNSSVNILDQLTSTHNEKNGVVVNLGSLLSSDNKITADFNASNGFLMNGGELTAKGEVTASNNGRGPAEGDTLGHGLEIFDGIVDFKSFNGFENFGNGVNQYGGIIKMNQVKLNGNKLVKGAEAGNGFVKLGGMAEIYQAEINDNKGHGIYVNSTDTDPEKEYLYANDIEIKGNIDRGVYLESGNLILEDVDTENQIKVGGDAAAARHLIILNNSDEYRINAGKLDNAKTEKDLAALLIDSNATVDVMGAMIAGTTNGYGVWVDAGDVKLHGVTVKDNKRGIVWTNGKLTVDDNSIILNNTQYGILATDNGQKSGARAERVLNLNNVSIMGTGVASESLVGSGYGLAVLSDSTVRINNSAAPSTSFQISKNSEGGVYVANGDVEIIGAKIHDNHNFGITVAGEKKSSLKITNSEIYNDQKLGENSQQTGLLLNGANGQVTLNNVRIADNTENGIEFSGVTQLGCEKDCAIFGSKNGIKISGASATLSNLYIHDNTNAIEVTASQSSINIENMMISGNDIAMHLAATADTITIDANGSMLKNNKFGISTDNVTTANIALKNVTLTDNKTGIATAAQNTHISCVANCAIVAAEQAIKLSGKNNIVQGLSISNNQQGILLSGENASLTLQTTKMTNNRIGVLLKDVANAALNFDGAASEISHSEYSIKLENNTGLITVNNLYSSNTQRAGIYADITRANTKIGVTNSVIASSDNNGVEINVAANTSFDLKVLNSQVTNTARHGMYITENASNAAAGSKVFISDSSFNGNTQSYIDNRSVTALFVQNTTISGNGLDKNQRGIISSGSKDNEFVSGGAMYLQNVNIAGTQYAVTSSNYLEISRSTASAPPGENTANPGYRSQFRVQGSLVTGSGNRLVSYNPLGENTGIHISASGGWGELGGFIYTGNSSEWYFLNFRDHNELAFSGNPLGW